MHLVHRVHTRAAPSVVWGLLGDGQGWPQFELSLRGVRGRVTSGAHIMALLRMTAVGVPVDIVEAVPEERLALVVHLLPGLREELTFDLTASVEGGTDIALSVVVDGLLARPAALPLWLYDGFTARVLAARSDRIARLAARAAAGHRIWRRTSTAGRSCTVTTTPARAAPGCAAGCP